MKNWLLIVCASVFMGGCASVINDSTQPIRIDTKRSDGALVPGAECTLANDYGVFTGRSGTTFQIRRSGQHLDIVCKQSGNPAAVARGVSRINAGMVGNILTVGVLGAIIDHNKGIAYSYPTWMQLEFGKTLVFDTINETYGMPALGVQPTLSNGLQ